MVKTTGRKSTKVQDKRRVARKGPRSESAAKLIGGVRKQLQDNFVAFTPVPAPKLDIGKASRAGMNKVLPKIKKEEAGKNRRAKLMLAVAKDKTKPLTIGAIMRKGKAVSRTRKPGMATARRSLNK